MDLLASSGTTTSFSVAGEGMWRVVRIGWTSASDGTYTAQLSDAVGEAVRFVTNPGAAAPTANWDVTLTDDDGIDILGAAGANRHTSNTEEILLADATENVNGKPFGPGLAIAITNAGDSKTGELVLYMTV